MTKQEFCTAIRSAYELQTANLITVLRTLIEFDYPPQVASLDFEVFEESFREGFPIRAFFMDGDNNEYFVYVDGEAQYPSPVDPGLLEIERLYDRKLESEYLAANPSEFGEYVCWEIAAAEIIPWFAKCWVEAGGKLFSRAATIAMHDDRKYFDLLVQKWFERRYEL